MSSKKIAVVLGTGRSGRESKKVAEHTLQAAVAAGFNASLVDVKDFPSAVTVPPWEESEIFSSWRKCAAEVDGFVLVVPEYNHSFPGELKILLDSAFKEYAGKPVGIVGVSNGEYGGLRAIEHLKPFLVGLNLYVLNQSVPVGQVENFSEEAISAVTKNRLSGMLAALSEALE